MLLIANVFDIILGYCFCERDMEFVRCFGVHPIFVLYASYMRPI